MIEIEKLERRTYCNQCDDSSRNALIRAKLYEMVIYICEDCAHTLSKQLTAAKFTLVNLLAHLGIKDAQ